ncbi:DUF1737 domain-containing protein [Enterococcus faecalis]|uniref:DUF1737 domain-containing protein n=1 Tax=Enterococcus faecalis TaxID=1351 RepID=UPI0009B2418D|nr:DUF1737 domain-containing protein [Enterococcus faecalis]HBI2089399.1 DUF1737 domain-containing protein [Enterococcus faecalis]
MVDKKYQIISAYGNYGVSDLVKSVNKEIAKGWKPQGGVNSETITGDHCYYQAMVKDI